MYCENCGSQVKEGSAFCIKCGARIEDSPAPKKERVMKIQLKDVRTFLFSKQGILALAVLFLHSIDRDCNCICTTG